MNFISRSHTRIASFTRKIYLFTGSECLLLRYCQALDLEKETNKELRVRNVKNLGRNIPECLIVKSTCKFVRVYTEKALRRAHNLRV